MQKIIAWRIRISVMLYFGETVASKNVWPDCMMQNFKFD